MLQSYLCAMPDDTSDNKFTPGFKDKALEIFVTSPELPYENGEEQEPKKWVSAHKSLVFWEKLAIVCGLVVVVIVAAQLRHSNTIGLGLGKYKYRIQQRFDLFGKESEKVKTFRLFPSLTICNNEINACTSTESTSEYGPCVPDPDILQLMDCSILRFKGSTSGYDEDPCPLNWNSASPTASALKRYCITLNSSILDSSQNGWSATHPNDRLRIVVYSNRTSSRVTPWYGGFLYIHNPFLDDSSIFAMDNSNSFSTGRFYHYSYDVIKNYTSEDAKLTEFKNCITESDEGPSYELFLRESETLAPDSLGFGGNESFLTTLSLELHGENPELTCLYDQDLNGYSEVLEHMAGLLVIPELGGLLIAGSYVLFFKICCKFCCNSDCTCSKCECCYWSCKKAWCCCKKNDSSEIQCACEEKCFSKWSDWCAKCWDKKCCTNNGTSACLSFLFLLIALTFVIAVLAVGLSGI